MRSVKIANTRLKLDAACDRVPGVSTVTNCIDLVQKILIVPYLRRQGRPMNVYYHHIDQKPFSRSLLLLCPFGGQVIVSALDAQTQQKTDASSDFYEDSTIINNPLTSIHWANQEKQLWIQALQEDVWVLQEMPKETKDDLDLMRIALHASVQQNQTPWLLAQIGPRLRMHKEFMQECVSCHMFALAYVSESVRQDPEFTKWLLQEKYRQDLTTA